MLLFHSRSAGCCVCFHLCFALPFSLSSVRDDAGQHSSPGATRSTLLFRESRPPRKYSHIHEAHVRRISRKCKNKKELASKNGMFCLIYKQLRCFVSASISLPASWWFSDFLEISSDDARAFPLDRKIPRDSASFFLITNFLEYTGKFVTRSFVCLLDYDSQHDAPYEREKSAASYCGS